MDSVGVFSYIELYMTAFGWMMYSAFWKILVMTGVAWWGFAYALYINVRKPMESQESKAAAGVSLRRMQWDFGMMVLVVAFCVTPWSHISINKLTICLFGTFLTSFIGT